MVIFHSYVKLPEGTEWDAHSGGFLKWLRLQSAVPTGPKKWCRFDPSIRKPCMSVEPRNT